MLGSLSTWSQCNSKSLTHWLHLSCVPPGHSESDWQSISSPEVLSFTENNVKNFI